MRSLPKGSEATARLGVEQTGEIQTCSVDLTSVASPCTVSFPDLRRAGADDEGVGFERGSGGEVANDRGFRGLLRSVSNVFQIQTFSGEMTLIGAKAADRSTSAPKTPSRITPAVRMTPFVEGQGCQRGVGSPSTIQQFKANFQVMRLSGLRKKRDPGPPGSGPPLGSLVQRCTRWRLRRPARTAGSTEKP